MYGLVLAGGKSTRMGSDKSSLVYHHLPQRHYLVEILHGFCTNVFVSARQTQIAAWNDDLSYLPDDQESEGPLSGVYTAFSAFPGQKWCVLACDMPFIQKSSLQYLLQKHSDAEITVFYNSSRESIEPFPSIWQMKSVSLLRDFYQSGGRSPMRFFEAYPPAMLIPPEKNWLLNVNYPAEFDAIQKILHQ